jgi:hypothetical protein
MTRVTVPLVAGAAIAALMAGCGSSSSSSSTTSSSSSTTESSSSTTQAAGAATVDSAYATAAGEICTTATMQVQAVARPGDPAKATAADLPAWASYFDKVLPIFETALQKLSQVPPPTTGGTELAAAAAKTVTVNADLTAIATAAHAGNLNQFDTALLTYAQDNAASDAAYDAIGLKACGSGTSAATSTTTASSSS